MCIHLCVILQKDTTLMLCICFHSSASSLICSHTHRGPTAGAPPLSSQWQCSTATPSLLSFQGNWAALLKGATSSASVQRGLLEAGSPAVDRIAGTSLTQPHWKNGVDSVMVSTGFCLLLLRAAGFMLLFIKSRVDLNMDEI